jgi:hypothetical protein
MEGFEEGDVEIHEVHWEYVKILLPIETLSESNSSEHWRLKHKRHSSQKTCVRMAFRQVKKIALPATVTLTRLSPRKLDDDNLVGAFKWIRDSVADCLIPGLAAGRSDCDPRIKWIYEQKKSTCKLVEIKIDFVSSCT